MIKTLSIQHYKSIKDLRLDCRRLNLFIGEPNVGKSNILEAVGLFALPLVLDFRGLARFQDLTNLFFENEPANTIEIGTDTDHLQLAFDFSANQMVANFATGAQYRFLLRGEWANTNSAANSVGDIRPYWFRSVKEFPSERIDFLSPPHGHNLFSILQSNKRLKLLVSEFVQDRGFKLTFRQATSELEISKEENNILTTYPYSLVSDTIQRIIFYTSAIESNPKNSTLVFEEPESSVFPYYTKYLAEKIALDTERQYFITTHNPYFLQAVIEKVPANELAINLVTMEQYQTEVKPLSERAYEEILTLSSDVFLNFDKLLEV